jgi:mono/diheme cytochrome c family protein
MLRDLQNHRGAVMKSRYSFSLLLASVVFFSGCESDRMSEKGFSLPEGDTGRGREAFLYMHCYECHTVEDESFPQVPGAEPPFVELGGPVSKVKTYGELVTAIINPSHKLAQGYPTDLVSNDGRSRMPVYNGYMTVQELIDIVMFLQPHYEVYVPPYDYRIYP